MRKLSLWATMLTISVLLVPCYLALAGNQDEASPPNKGEARPNRQTAGEQRSSLGVLGKTVKLEFKLAGPEEQPTFPVLCAIKDYSISHEISEPNHEHSVRIVGTLTACDDRGRVLLRYRADTTHSDLNEGFDATFKTRGSAILEMGKEKSLAMLGDQALTVVATAED